MSTAPAVIQPGSFLTLHYRLSGPKGDVVNTFPGTPATLTLGTGLLAPALEACLFGMAEDTHTVFELPAGVAFGERNPVMLQWLARQEVIDMGLPGEDYAVGDVLHFPTPNGEGEFAGVILEFRTGKNGDAIRLDFNHPLAGQPVRFEVQIISVL
ncbi:FKBP-type peptidyl-prolyl cis-trans isomerase [Candidatus Symbiobacter mobilis]|uniref:peptidylprolyl isomerase n=1 Tax=Candidatus Symbiobacter mobilis CR TaxID=946483 RepID=U5NEW2_9BURK|nr:FKBP-type peptidyl-prolyl cis-trans isomerase [Candidatus Symbiobacter mobilis]AGX88704.1 FKBP-type peptidyl-prolyl cis-trans isomerase SlpA [Candidatus Symbiobacter mobilis CR]